MSFDPTRLKTLGAATIGTLALAACADPVADTDLRPEGPPEVLAVLVFNDTENGAVEAATYCKPNDPKRPGLVGITAYGVNPIICPLDGSAVEPLTDAWPDAWYIRVIFDELLDPEVETLKPILDAMGNPTDNFSGSLERTQPVTLQCQGVDGMMVDVPYDGYYSPAGNRVTWPLGPSLVIRPLDPTVVPVESTCQVTIKPMVKDKDGNSLAGRDAMPFEFKLAPISVIGVFPGAGGTINPLVGGVDLTFNVEVDPSAAFCTDAADAVCGGDPTRIFSLTPEAMAENAFVDNYGGGLFVGADLLGGQTYTLTIPDGLKIEDKCGRESTVAAVPGALEFKTNPARFTGFNPGGGNAVAPAKKITLSFNQLIDTASFEEGTDFEMTPKPANFAISPPGGVATSTIRILGDYDLGETYKLTIKSGASISDIFGKQSIDFEADQITEFTTAAAMAITAQSPANGARITKAPTAAALVSLTFNQEIKADSLEMSEFTLTRADGTATGVTPAISAVGAALRVSFPALPAGSYRFTLNADATLTDQLGNTYTQAADRVINFSVADAMPTTPAPPFKCLGQP